MSPIESAHFFGGTLVILKGLALKSRHLDMGCESGNFSFDLVFEPGEDGQCNDESRNTREQCRRWR